MRHSMLRRISNPPNPIPRRRLHQQPITSREQLALQFRILSELGNATSHNHRALDLVPTRVYESGRQFAQAFVLFRGDACEDSGLGFCVVESAGFAVHHELFGAGECDAILGVDGGVVYGMAD